MASCSFWREIVFGVLCVLDVFSEAFNQEGSENAVHIFLTPCFDAANDNKILLTFQG